MKVSRRQIEKHYPAFAGLLAFVGLMIGRPYSGHHLRALITLMIIIYLVVFTSAYLSLLTLPHLQHHYSIKLLKKYERYDEMVHFIISPLRVGIYFTLIALLGLIFPGLMVWNGYILLYILMAFAVYALVATFRFVQILARIVM